jgi:rod shape-determining protein MreC
MRFIAAITIGILLILSLNFFSREVKGFFYSVSLPIQNYFWQNGSRASNFLEAIFLSKNIKKENEELKIRLQDTTAELAALQETRRENQFLRESLDIGLQKEFKLFDSNVIGKDLNQDSVLINSGSRDGISKGMPVISQQKALIGQVTEVYEKFSRVLLITSKDSSLDAKISDSSISGVAAGKGGLKLYLELIPQDKDIKEGDWAVSSSFGGLYPAGLLVGLVKEIEKSDLESFQKAELSPFFDMASLDKVFIIVDYE